MKKSIIATLVLSLSVAAVPAHAKGGYIGGQRAAAIAAEIFAPLIPAIITGGLILGFRNCIDQLYLFEHGPTTLVELSQFWAGMDHFL